jgi:hypothetical protein
VDDLLLRAFRFEVIAQANIALGAWNSLTEIAKRVQPKLPLSEIGGFTLGCIAPIQQFIVASGVISLILFPKPRRPESPEGLRALSRGEELRRLWNVSLDSPLANRTLRNSLEHIDERLEEWIDSTRNVRFSPFALVPDLAYLQAQGGEAIRVFIGTVPWRFIIYGEEQNAEVLIHEIKGLADRLGPSTIQLEGKQFGHSGP